MTTTMLDLLGTIKTDYPAVAAALLRMAHGDFLEIVSRHLPAAAGPQQSFDDPAETFAIALGTAAGLDEPDCFLSVTLTAADEDRWDEMSVAATRSAP